MSVDQWCIRPGNYSSDGYRTSTVSDKGWRGGGVFITGADECEIVKSFGFTDTPTAPHRAPQTRCISPSLLETTRTSKVATARLRG